MKEPGVVNVNGKRCTSFYSNSGNPDDCVAPTPGRPDGARLTPHASAYWGDPHLPLRSPGQHPGLTLTRPPKKEAPELVPQADIAEVVHYLQIGVHGDRVTRMDPDLELRMMVT